MRSALLLFIPAILLSAAGAAEETTPRDAGQPPPVAGSASTPIAKDWTRGTTIPVKPLDDPANPYRGQYGPVDRWAWQHAIEPEAVEKARRVMTPPEGAQVTEPQPALILIPVDAAGWALPFVEFQRRIHGEFAMQAGQEPKLTVAEAFLADSQRWAKQEAERDARQQQPDADMWPPPYNYASHGKMPPHVYAEWESWFHGAQADRYPVIPAWLGENPPLAAVFLPDGTIVCYGPLGLHFVADPEDERRGMSLSVLSRTAEEWYRYTAEGKLLERRPSSADPWQWMLSWNPELAQKVQLRGGYPSVRNGLVTVVQQSSGAGFIAGAMSPASQVALAAFLWDGTELALDDPNPVFPPGVTQLLMRDNLITTYRTQLRSGRASRTTLSPYAGQPDGPVSVDPAPRPLPVIAKTHGGPGASRGIKVRPLDDPANPYSEQYSEWDRWIFEHAGKSDPQMQVYYEEQTAKANAAREAARKAGQPEPPRQMEPYRTPPDSLWRSVSAKVDKDGWLVPMALSPPDSLYLDRDRRQPVTHVTTDFRIGAGGELPPAVWTQFEAARQGVKRAAYQRIFPPVPAWLGAQPVVNLVFLPDGSIVTWGERGSYQAPASAASGVDAQPAPAKNAGTQAWMHYSADGQLLGRTSLSTKLQWLPLTFPLAQEIYDRETAAGHEVRFDDGYLIVFSGPLLVKVEGAGPNHYRMASPPPEIIAAYDWDGTPVDFSQPLTRPAGYGMTLAWQDLVE
jgi:hypothetical protein